jgi:hypothetical protein
VNWHVSGNQFPRKISKHFANLANDDPRKIPSDSTTLAKKLKQFQRRVNELEFEFEQFQNKFNQRGASMAGELLPAPLSMQEPAQRQYQKLAVDQRQKPGQSLPPQRSTPPAGVPDYEPLLGTSPAPPSPNSGSGKSLQDLIRGGVKLKKVQTWKFANTSALRKFKVTFLFRSTGKISRKE